MDEKQSQQYRQHFNLSEATKRMLKELTAQRYPGKQRRQSQLIEDLITEAFTKKEHTMSAVTTEMQDPEPGKLAPSTIEAVNMAQQEALYTDASEIGPEHLFLGLLEQGNERVVKVLRSLGMDVKALRLSAAKVFGTPGDVESKAQEGQSSKKPEDKENFNEQEWRQRRREELLNELKPGEVRKGVVSNITNFGAFVDLGGAEGLLPISQLAWSPVNHPSEILHIGQEVEVQVLNVDKEKKKILLSLKRVGVDPWITVGQRYTPGQVVTGTITKIAPFGVLARVEDSVEGLIHLSEITPGTNLKTDLHEGQQVQLCILSIDIERRRLSLSMRQAEQIFPQGIPDGEPPELLEGNVPEPFTIMNVYLPLSRDAKGCIQWAKSFATHSMQSALVLPEHLLLSVLRCQGMRQFLTQLLPATEPLLADLTGEMGYTNYIDQLIRTRVRQTIRQETIGKSTTTVRPMAQANLCPSCKRPVQTSWKHCVYCGASLVSFCPSCGAPRAEVEGVQFCYECGNRLEQVTSVSPKQIVKRVLQSGSNFSKGQGVRILDGPFTEYIGTVSDIDIAQNKVTVLISFFGKETQVVLDFLQVEKI